MGSNIRLIVLSVIFFLMVGCRNMGSYEEFGFDSAKIHKEWGSVNIKVIGSDKKISNDDYVRGSPYKIIVWFSLNKDRNIEKVKVHNVKINSLQLQDKKNQVNIEKLHKRDEATLFFSNIEIPHKDFIFSIVYSFNDEKNKEIDTTSIKATNKKERISVWDKIMGI